MEIQKKYNSHGEFKKNNQAKTLTLFNPLLK